MVYCSADKTTRIPAITNLSLPPSVILVFCAYSSALKARDRQMDRKREREREREREVRPQVGFGSIIGAIKVSIVFPHVSLRMGQKVIICFSHLFVAQYFIGSGNDHKDCLRIVSIALVGVIFETHFPVGLLDLGARGRFFQLQHIVARPLLAIQVEALWESGHQNARAVRKDSPQKAHRAGSPARCSVDLWTHADGCSMAENENVKAMVPLDAQPCIVRCQM